MNRLAARIMAVLFGSSGALITHYGAGPLAENVDIEISFTQRIGLIALGFVVAGVIGYFAGPPIVRKTWKAISWIEERVSRASLLEIVMGTVGLIIGLIIANLVRPLLAQIPFLGSVLPAASMLLLGYLGLMIARTKKDDVFAFTGRSRLTRRGTGVQPKILDTSVIIDGRIADVADAGFLEGSLIIPSYVIDELRHIADSQDVMRRSRGRRGLDVLARLQQDLGVPVEILEKDAYPNLDVDNKLIRLAESMKASIVTNDYNLNKVATLQGVSVLNVNELATAVRPVVLPGEELVLHVVRDGKEAGQGIAYLDDGTMIVIEGGKRYIGEDVSVVVTSTLQTAAGRMIFARPRQNERSATT